MTPGETEQGLEEQARYLFNGTKARLKRVI
jgi:hypothetical protein